MYYYSGSVGGFFVLGANTDTLPPDSVPVSKEEYDALFDAQARGKMIVPDENGRPIAVDQPPPSAEQIMAHNSAMRDALLHEAGLRIAPLQDAIDLDIATDGDAALLKKWKLYRVSVNRVDLTKYPAAWPDKPQ